MEDTGIDNPPSFLKIVPKHLAILLLLTMLLLCIVFWPAIEWARRAARSQVVRSENMEMAIPRLWLTNANGSAVEAWTPCLSIFCSLPPRSSLKIGVNEAIVGKADGWLEHAEIVLRDRRFSRPETRQMRGATGYFQCVEGRSEVVPHVVDSFCAASESGLVAGFEGQASELNDFYAIIASVKIVKAR